MVFRINPDNIETFTLETNVNREVSNDTNGNFTGSLHVFPRRLQGLKEVYPMASYGSGPFSGDINLESKRKSIVEAPEGANRAEALTNYMGDVHAQASLAKYQSTASILRIQSQTELNMDAQRRLFLQKYIARQPVRFGQEAEWDTTNYHCLNFFTSSNTPVSSALIYPNSFRLKSDTDGVNFNQNNQIIVSNSFLNIAGGISESYACSYQLYEAFSFDFWIKPKYNAPAETLWGVSASNYYRPGALLHFSSAYAITLHSGSSKNQNDLADKFRICLQIGNDTDTAPGLLVAGVDHSGSISGSTFWTSDNALPLNEWTHVAITYGGHQYNQGTGSMWINGVKDRDIAIGPMIPVATMSFDLNLWGCLYVGNYYQGRKQPGQNLAFSGSYDQSRFWSVLGGGSFSGTGPWDKEALANYLFNTLTQRYPGFSPGGEAQYQKGKSYYLPPLIANFNLNEYVGNYGDTPYIGSPPWDGPRSHSFVYPLNAEVHDIKLWGKRLSEPEIASLQTASFSPEKYDDVRFWLPPFFTEESPYRTSHPASPFFSYGNDDFQPSSSYPFAPRLAMSTNGFYPYLENFLADRVTEMVPIQWNLRWFENETVSSITELTSDQWMYENLVSSSAIRKRLYTVLPCDHGNFNPRFNNLEVHNYGDRTFYNQFGTKTWGRINLKEALFFITEQDENDSSSNVEEDYAPAQNSMLGLSNDLTSSIVNQLYGARPEDTTLTPGNGFAVWHRLQSADSHNVIIFDISNLYYGESIQPRSIELYTNDLSGSGGAFGFRMIDNGRGGLVRADTDSAIAEWSTLGTVLYEEGVIIIKYPMLTFFGNNGWTLKFKGTRNVYVFSLEAVANPMTCTESADPIYSNIQLPPQVDYNPNEQDRKQVFIGSVLVHDENMNVIMRSTFSQAVVKKSGDKILTKIKIDF